MNPERRFTMQLITKELEKILPPLYAQDGKKEKTVYAKLFCPWNNWTWYILEYSHEEKVCFGYVIGLDSEYGYFSISELESINYRGLGIERDFNFHPCKLSELIKNKY